MSATILEFRPKPKANPILALVSEKMVLRRKVYGDPEGIYMSSGLEESLRDMIRVLEENCMYTFEENIVSEKAIQPLFESYADLIAWLRLALNDELDSNGL
ncbi:MAG: hypothetical protein ABW125_11670 [Candidatus Thiodiazotropha lotti]